MLDVEHGRMAMAAMLSLVLAAALAAPVAETASGLVEGEAATGITVYRGVPYAAPPVGDLRWRAPQPAAHWGGVREAKTVGPACMQSGDPWPPWSPVTATSEDCLTLNVWVPEGTKGLPVMVWIHGGGWSAGSGSAAAYDGVALARHGVVVVTFNYRVGPFGFLAHPGLSAEAGGVSGNYGLLDQIAALEWVQANIAAFGGDPKRVTAFGQSAGSMSIVLLTVMPRAKGLFAQAIGESGGVFIPPAISPSAAGFVLKGAESEGEAFASAMNARTVEEMRALPAEALAVAKGAGGFHFILDANLVPEEPYVAYVAGRQALVPLLLGTNADEGLSFFDVKSVTAANFSEGLRGSLGVLPPPLLAAYPAATDEQAKASRGALERDLRFGYDMWAWTRLAAKSAAPVFAYRFEQRPPWPKGSAWAEWGAGHGAELPYVFGTLDAGWAWSDDDRRAAEMMAAYWTNFAKTGNPNGEGLPAWPAYASDTRQVMRLSAEAKPGDEPGVAALEVLDALFESVR